MYFFPKRQRKEKSRPGFQKFTCKVVNFWEQKRKVSEWGWPLRDVPRMLLKGSRQVHLKAHLGKIVESESIETEHHRKIHKLNLVL